MQDRKTYKVNCKSCGRFLCRAPANSETYCPGCQSWTKAEDKKQAKKEPAGGGS